MDGKAITCYETQKANKPPIETLVNTLLSGRFKDEFEGFLIFLSNEKIRLSWGSTNSYNANYKGKRVARIAFGQGDKFTEYHVSIIIHTAQRDQFDGYLDGQSDEIANQFLASISNKCTNCACCAPGKSFDVLGKHYVNVCFGGLGSHGFRFINPDAKQMELIKKIVCVRKEYIAKMLKLGINPGTAY